MTPVLYIVIPCYNEQAVLPITAPLFLQKLKDLTAAGRISPDSRMFLKSLVQIYGTIIHSLCQRRQPRRNLEHYLFSGAAG